RLIASKRHWNPHQLPGRSNLPDCMIQAEPKRRSFTPNWLVGDRALTIFIAFASALFTIYLFHPVFRGQIFAVGDLLNQNFPFRKIYADALHQHVSFLWTPNLYSGFYLFGEGQTGMLHPAHLLLYSIFPLKLA